MGCLSVTQSHLACFCLGAFALTGACVWNALPQKTKSIVPRLYLNLSSNTASLGKSSSFTTSGISSPLSSMSLHYFNSLHSTFFFFFFFFNIALPGLLSNNYLLTGLLSTRIKLHKAREFICFVYCHKPSCSYTS